MHDRLLRPEEQVPCEEVMPRVVGDHTNRDLIVRVGACIQVLHESVAPLEERAEFGAELAELLFRHGSIHLAPRDGSFAGRLLHDEFVVGGTPGVVAGMDDQRPEMRNPPLAPAHHLLVERCCGKIPIDVAKIRKS